MSFNLSIFSSLLSAVSSVYQMLIPESIRGFLWFARQPYLSLYPYINSAKPLKIYTRLCARAGYQQEPVLS